MGLSASSGALCSWHGMSFLCCHQILRCVFIHCPTCMSKSECVAETLLMIRAIYIHSFCYFCALPCPWELCSSLPAFTHKYPQWDLQIYPSVENWCMILRAAMQHPNYPSHKAWEKKGGQATLNSIFIRKQLNCDFFRRLKYQIYLFFTSLVSLLLAFLRS